MRLSLTIATFLSLYLFIIADVCLAQKTLLIFAGAGMKEPLNEAGMIFEKKYGIKVIYDYEGSGRLGNKILLGQTPDLFIPGGSKWSNILKSKGYILYCKPIAQHIPVIITPLSNNKVNNLYDLKKREVTLVIGDDKACAIGRVTNRIFKKAKINKNDLNIVAYGVTIKQLVHWIEAGNADASIVWHVDALESGRVRIIKIPDKFNEKDIIPVCILKDSKNKKVAKKFISFLFSKQGKALFKKYGFSILD